MPVHTVKTYWRDASGDEATSSFNTTTTNTVTIEAVLTEMQALSDLELVNYEFTKSLGEPSGADGPNDLDASHPYADDKAKLVMEFSTAASRKVHPRISIPGPKHQVGGNDLFGNDFALLNSVAPAPTAIAALTGNAKTSGGNDLTVLRSAYLDVIRGKRAAR